MATKRKRTKRKERRRAGSEQRDQKHRVGGDWTTVALPQGIKIWKQKEGNFKLDIIPYKVKDNPFAETGKWYYERTYYRHAGIGPDNGMYCCPARNWNKPCPICEHRAMLAARPQNDDDTEKLIRNLAPKERQLWLVYDREDADEGVQIMEISNFAFGATLDEERRNADEDEDYARDFDDPDGGAYLRVRFLMESSGGFKPWPKCTKIDFKPRPDGLSEELLDHGYCPDTMLIEIDYDELKKIFLQVGDDEPADDDDEPADDDDEPADDDDEQPDANGDKPKRTRKKPAKKKSKPKTADELGINRLDEVEYDGQTCTVMKVSSDGTSLTLMDENDDPIKAIAPADVKLLADEDDVPFDEDDDDDEEVTEEAPVAASEDNWDEDDEDW